MIRKFSQSFIFTKREAPKIAECRSHKFLLRGSFLTMISSGIYSYLPLGYQVLSNINKLIRKHMNKAGAQELFMSALQPMEMWEKTGRDKDLKDVMLKLEDRKKRQLCLGPTHEEEITEIARRYVFSHKQLPFILYQIQTKFRDEPRPRFGLMRSCEFIMKDAYSFDKDKEGLAANYEKMLAAYKAIFKECSFDFIMVEADSGAMGGSLSHEFMVKGEIGEDMLYFCPEDKNYYKAKEDCKKCPDNLIPEKMIEIGHIFQLGTKYSKIQEGLFLDSQGKRQPFIMGCYGIGVSRILSAIAEVNSDDKGLIWPKGISPFDVTLVVLSDDILHEAIDLSMALESQGLSILIDERDEPAGVKFNDAYLIGNPYIVVMGKKYIKDKRFDLEVRKRKESYNFSQEELINYLSSEYLQ